jgi:uncharacterized metal-binding protein
MAEKCLCEADEVILLPCSGGSNCGQLANTAAVRLTQNNIGTIFCLAGIGGHISGMIASTKAGKRVVAIDGCGVACAKKTLEHAGIEPTDYIVITELGIKKNHDFDLPESDIAKVISAVKDSLAEMQVADD